MKPFIPDLPINELVRCFKEATSEAACNAVKEGRVVVGLEDGKIIAYGENFTPLYVIKTVGDS